jgi:membrane-associated phospholipid phosphatase
VTRGRLAATVVVAVSLLVVSWLPVRGAAVSSGEATVFRWINELPDVPYALPWLAMQVGNVGATVVAAGVALWSRRRRLALRLGAGGVVAWLAAKGLKALVGRGRPAAVLDDVVLRHAATTGTGWVSGHAAVTAALLTIAWPSLGARAKVALVALVSPMYVVRVYVGEHLPLDMIGGALLGVTGGVVMTLAAAERAERRRRRGVRPCWRRGPGATVDA